MLGNEAIELEFVSVLIYYTYIKESKREESMMCRNDKSRVDPKWKTQHLPPVPEHHEGKQNKNKIKINMKNEMEISK